METCECGDTMPRTEVRRGKGGGMRKEREEREGGGMRKEREGGELV